MVDALILGGAGFIGYHLAQHLASLRDYRITLVDNLSRGALDADLQGLLDQHRAVSLTNADLLERDSFDGLGGPYDEVYLLAGMVGVRNVASQPDRVVYVNTGIILNTLEWLRRVGCGRLLFASTSEVYAGSVENGTAAVPTAEDAPATVLDTQAPRATYAITKILGEAAVTHYAAAGGYGAVVARYHNVYGPRMGFDHVVPELMERVIHETDPFPVYGLEHTRAFCYVSDAVSATHALMTCPLERCEIVHVGNDAEEVPIRHLLSKLFDATGFHPAIEEHPAASGSVSRRCPDLGKLKALTGYRPAVDLKEGLGLTWEWYRRSMSVSR